MSFSWGSWIAAIFFKLKEKRLSGKESDGGARGGGSVCIFGFTFYL